MAHPQIEWLRRDLRLCDHQAFCAAVQNGPVIPVYVLDDKTAGERAMGGAARWWLHHGTLPDGTRCRLGGREKGFVAEATLHDLRGLLRVATGGSAGLYQAWEAGEWSSRDSVAMFALFVANADTLGDAARAKGPWRWVARSLHRLNRNTKAESQRNMHAHYDLGNDFYAAWLDPTMSYSSAYFFRGEDLEAGQHRKWESLAERIGTPETLLEIGCGWSPPVQTARSGQLPVKGRGRHDGHVLHAESQGCGAGQTDS